MFTRTLSAWAQSRCKQPLYIVCVCVCVCVCVRACVLLCVGPSSNNRRPPSDVGLQYPSSSYRGGGAAAPIPPSRLSDLLLHGPNDFESLESKLKEALQSPGLQVQVQN